MLDLNLSSQIDSADIYIERGNIYDDLGKSQLALDDYNNAIRINPDDAGAYVNRGFAKEEFWKYYCDDYKKACELGKKRACTWFSSECK